MKVLLLTTHLNLGGISTYVRDLAFKLKDQGLDPVCASSGGLLVAEIEKRGIKHFSLPIKTKSEVNPKLAFALMKLIELVEAEDIQVIHAHTRVTQVLAQMVSAFEGTPFVSTCHGFYKPRFSRKLFPCWGGRVAAISDAVRESLVNDFKVPKKQVQLIYNGVQVEKFQKRVSEKEKAALKKYFGLDENGLVVGGISRIEESKGYRQLIEASKIITARFPTVKFLLVGDGKAKGSLVEYVRKEGLSGNVVFSGAIEDVSIPLSIIDIFVLPAWGSEGFGLSVLEGMAAGKPVVATDVGGVYVLVKDGENGFLVPPKDVDALNGRICELLADRNLRERMGKRSAELASEKFSLDRVAQMVRDMYEEVLS